MVHWGHPPGGGNIRAEGTRAVTMAAYYHFVSGNATPDLPAAIPRASTATTMFELVIHKARQRGALAAVPLVPFLAGKGPEAGEVLAASAHLKKLKSESLMFEAASDSGTRVIHGAPVENLQEGMYAKGETKANIIFRLSFA